VYRELYELGELDRTLSVVVRRLVPDEEEDDEDDLDRGFKVHPILIPVKVVREQCCGSGMFIPDPGSLFLPIPDLAKIATKRGVKKNSCHTFFYSHKFNKIVNYFIFEMLNKKIWANFFKELFFCH
jgi:hypothetical protein